MSAAPAASRQVSGNEGGVDVLTYALGFDSRAEAPTSPFILEALPVAGEGLANYPTAVGAPAPHEAITA